LGLLVKNFTAKCADCTLPHLDREFILSLLGRGFLMQVSEAKRVDRQKHSIPASGVGEAGIFWALY
jgi:hypothetical protein